MADNRLQHSTILVVEDEYFLAIELEEELREAGAVVVGPASSVEDALALVEQTALLNAAILDVNLDGKLVFPVADKLMSRNVPFAFTTGYHAEDIPTRYADAPRLEKPAQSRALWDALAKMLKVT